MDVALKVCRYGRLNSRKNEVSILVLLDVALKEGSLSSRSGFRSTCFNPCSLGCCSESAPTMIPYPVQIVVSILVLLDVALKVGIMTSLVVYILTIVSILVLLDVALKDAGITVPSVPSKGFNPCSLGCCSERLCV